MATLWRCCRPRRTPETEPGDVAANPEQTNPSHRQQTVSRTTRDVLPFQQRELNSDTPNHVLVRRCLLELPAAVTSDSEMPALDMLCDRAEDDEFQWIQILLDMIPALPLHHPLSGALIGIIVETMPNPTKETLLSASGHLLHATRERKLCGSCVHQQVWKRLQNSIATAHNLSHLTGPLKVVFTYASTIECALIEIYVTLALPHDLYGYWCQRA